MRSLLGLVLIATAAVVPGFAERAAQGHGPPLTGSARISGRVQAVDNSAPVRGANVTLSGNPGTHAAGSAPARIELAAETDDNGNFSFDRLPGGAYSVSVQPRSRFLALEQPVQASVKDGQTLHLPIRLQRSGAITGRITDRSGEGVLGVEVLALRRHDFRGHVTVTAAFGARGSTDDRGQFRLFNLSPGDYYVLAAPARTARPLTGSRRFDVVTTYYPGTPLRAEARLVRVRGGRDTANVNFSPASDRLYTLTVDASDSRGAPLGRDAFVTLNSTSDVYLSSSMRTSRRQDDGRFVFSDVPAGDYYLIATTSARHEEAAYADVTVDRDATLQIRTNIGGRVAGRIVIEDQRGGSGAATAPSNVVVTATRPPGKFGPSYATEPMAHPKGSERFELTGVRGPMTLHAQMSGALLVSISREGGQNLAGKPLEFTGTEDIDDLVIVFTRRRADVEVTLTGLREPEDPENVLVMLFSEDPTRWHAGSLQYTSIQSTQEMPVHRRAAAGRAGRSFTFRLGPVVPGRYLLAAVPSPGYAYPTDEGVLQRLREVAVPVTLVDGKTERVELGVSR